MKFNNILILILVLLIVLISNKVNERFYNKENKKIAFCFLIYEEIYHEDLWKSFLDNVDKSKYSIYIHYKKDKPLKYFNDHKLKNTIETCWGCLSIVHAQNLILKEALKDNMNQHFIWLSDSCVPIKTFDYIYNYLDTSKSYFNIAPDSQVFPRANNAIKYIDRTKIKKAFMPSIINRKHAKLFIDNDENIKLWFNNINNVDEIVYITLVHYYKLENELVLTPNIAAGSIIFASWTDMRNFKYFEKSKLSKNRPNSYNYICPEELNYLIKSKSLFARKFMKNCGGLEPLYRIFKQKINN